MVQTKGVPNAQTSGKANGIAGHVGKDRRDSRVFGSSWRGDFIYGVR
jgi:hypothetical protein